MVTHQWQHPLTAVMVSARQPRPLLEAKANGSSLARQIGSFTHAQELLREGTVT
jgi:hypothetical protein